jgi:hypothetical protein
MTNTELLYRAMRMIAAAHETMKDAGREHRVEAVVLLAAVAKVVHDDMTGMLTSVGGPGVLAAQVELLTEQVRLEMERMHIHGWVKQ